MTGKLHIFKDPEELAGQVSHLLVTWIIDAPGDRYHLALSGGSTPNLLFSALANHYAGSAVWQKTHFWWVDERMVPPGDPESNFGVAQKLLFANIAIPPENIHRIRGEADPAVEALRYAGEIDEQLEKTAGWPRFDLVLLGMGDDGHTASIFPDQLTLIDSDKICEVAHHPLTLRQRITLTGKVINRAASVCFLVTGENKAGQLTEIALGGEKARHLPAFAIRPVNGQLDWYVDEQAARLLP